MMATACPAPHVVGNIRVQPITPYLVRIEQKADQGFEDRATFTVVDRTPGAVDGEIVQTNGKTILATTQYRVSVPDGAQTFEGIRVETPNGRLIHKLAAKDLGPSYLPSPSALPAFWILADNPRAVPPAWGALPPPGNDGQPHSGWDLTNNAPDLYVFFPQASGYAAFRADFVRLTGPVPMVPLFTFGLWYSRYHPYSEESALEIVDTFRRKHIPLDLFVVDTDWRVGASCGYQVNTNLFPDMRRFIRRAHDVNVRVMFNDHPEPVGDHAMDPKELRFRRDGLASLLDMGADVWWFDRNWHIGLQTPADGLDKEVWGMRLYHDVTQANRPNQRPLIMSNVDGINNGVLDAPSHPAAHRFPIWWTGDTVGEWKYLRLGVENGVDSGILSLLPYVNEDLGGHHGEVPAEFYTRFMQFGAFSPVTRIHCTTRVSRYPWQYGDRIEKTVGGYFRLRYRLLPTLYTAAHDAYRSGTPILRRCDLEWPQHPEARDNTQYLFGDDLLVAPIIEPADTNGTARRSVWIPEGEWEDVWTGVTQTGPATIDVSATLEQMPLFVRRGGIVATIPQIFFTQTAAWTNITLDAYVPASDAAHTRRLYEDDGLTTAYTNGAYGLTETTLRRSGSQVELTAGPAAGSNHFQSDRRAWTLRLHLPKGQTVGSVELNGERLDGNGFAILPPAAAPTGMPFEGAGSPPPPESGPILEMAVPAQPTASPLDLIVELKPMKEKDTHVLDPAAARSDSRAEVSAHP